MMYLGDPATPAVLLRTSVDGNPTLQTFLSQFETIVLEHFSKLHHEVS